jgi:hypothetical protein
MAPTRVLFFFLLLATSCFGSDIILSDWDTDIVEPEAQAFVFDNQTIRSGVRYTALASIQLTCACPRAARAALHSGSNYWQPPKPQSDGCTADHSWNPYFYPPPLPGLVGTFPSTGSSCFNETGGPCFSVRIQNCYGTNDYLNQSCLLQYMSIQNFGLYPPVLDGLTIWTMIQNHDIFGSYCIVDVWWIPPCPTTVCLAGSITPQRANVVFITPSGQTGVGDAYILYIPPGGESTSTTAATTASTTRAASSTTTVAASTTAATTTAAETANAAVSSTSNTAALTTLSTSLNAAISAGTSIASQATATTSAAAVTTTAAVTTAQEATNAAVSASTNTGYATTTAAASTTAAARATSTGASVVLGDALSLTSVAAAANAAATTGGHCVCGGIKGYGHPKVAFWLICPNENGAAVPPTQFDPVKDGMNFLLLRKDFSFYQPTYYTSYTNESVTIPSVSTSKGYCYMQINYIDTEGAGYLMEAGINVYNPNNRRNQPKRSR